VETVLAKCGGYPAPNLVDFGTVLKGVNLLFEGAVWVGCSRGKV